jgi:organic radical activating enzyme
MTSWKTISKKYNIKSIDFYQAGDCNVFTDNIYFCGCDLRCGYCYNKDLWTETGKDFTLDELLKKLDESDNEFVAYMGGEPVRQDINSLTDKLHERNKKVILFTGHPNPWLGEFKADYYHVDVKLFSNFIYIEAPFNIKEITYGLVSTGKDIDSIEEKFKHIINKDIYIKHSKELPSSYAETKILREMGAKKLHFNERIKLI